MADDSLTPGPFEFSADQERTMRAGNKATTPDHYDLGDAEQLSAAQDRLKAIGLSGVQVSGPAVRAAKRDK